MMWRRTLVAGLLGTTAMVGAYTLGGAWIEHEAKNRLGALSQQLPAGAQLQWSRVEAQPFSLGLKIQQVRMALPEHALVREVRAGELVLAQATPGPSTATGTLGSASATDVRITMTDGGELVIGAVAGRDVDVRMLTDALRSPDGLLALVDAEIHPIELKGIRWTQGQQQATAARLAIGGFADRRMRDFALEQVELADPVLGKLRLAEATAREIDLAVPTREPWPEDPIGILRLLDRATLAGIKISGLNYQGAQGTIALAELELGHAGGGRIEAFSVEGFGGTDSIGGGHVGLERLRLERLDWRAVDLDRLGVAVAVLDQSTDEEPVEGDETDTESDAEEEEASQIEPGGELAREFAGLEALGQLTKIVLGPVELVGLGFAEGDNRLALQSVELRGQRNGHAERLVLEGLSLAGGEEGWSFRLGQIEQDPVQFVIPDLAERLAATERTQEALEELTAAMAEVTWQTRTAFRRVEVQREELTVFGIAAVDLAMSEDGSKKKIDFGASDILIDLGAVNEQVDLEGVVPSGIDRLILSIRLKSAFDTAEQGFEIETFAVDAPGLGASSLSLKAVIGDDLARDPTTALSEGSLLGAEFRYRDAGYVERWLKEIEEERGQRRDALVAGLMKQLKAAEPGRSLLDQERGAQLETFLKRPRTLVVSLKPAKPVPLSTLAVQGMAQPRQLAKTLGLQIRAENK